MPGSGPTFDGFTLKKKRLLIVKRELSRLSSVLVQLLLALSSAAVFAAESTPLGAWKTIDDQTGKPRGLIRITEVNGQYQGKIEKTFPDAGEDPNPKCDNCSGVRRDQPVIGMTILWGLTKQGEEYADGKVLDPENGKVYRAKMTLADGGKTLHVRGFIGFSLLGRTQVWLREE